MSFIGFSEDYEKYKKSDEGKYSDNEHVTEGNVISSDSIEPIGDEELSIILETRGRHDATLVFMQPNPDFYDSFYMEEETPDPLLVEARNIRRIYKDYMKYMYAEYTRAEYMDRLFEKHGGEQRFALMHTLGAIKDWIPPKPTLSRTSDDYELYERGDVPLYVGDFDPEYVNEATDIIGENMDMDAVDIVSDVNTNRLIQLNSELQFHVDDNNPVIKRSTNNSISGVSVKELQDLQQVFRSWYHPDDTSKDKTADNMKETREVFFKDSPEEIRAEYYTRQPLTSTKGELDKIIQQGYCEEEPEHHPDDMIVDPVTHSPMTYAEYCKRELIRSITADETEVDGWDPLKMMRHLGVGSSYEIRLMENKRRNKKKRRKKAGDLLSAVSGDGADTVTTLEQLNDLLFDD